MEDSLGSGQEEVVLSPAAAAELEETQRLIRQCPLKVGLQKLHHAPIEQGQV